MLGVFLLPAILVNCGNQLGDRARDNSRQESQYRDLESPICEGVTDPDTCETLISLSMCDEFRVHTSLNKTSLFLYVNDPDSLDSISNNASSSFIGDAGIIYCPPIVGKKPGNLKLTTVCDPWIETTEEAKTSMSIEKTMFLSESVLPTRFLLADLLNPKVKTLQDYICTSELVVDDDSLAQPLKHLFKINSYNVDSIVVDDTILVGASSETELSLIEEKRQPVRLSIAVLGRMIGCDGPDTCTATLVKSNKLKLNETVKFTPMPIYRKPGHAVQYRIDLNVDADVTYISSGKPLFSTILPKLIVEVKHTQSGKTTMITSPIKAVSFSPNDIKNSNL